MKNNYFHKLLLAFTFSVLFVSISQATDYIVSTKATLQSAYSNAVAGDNILVANGTYDWGTITLTNTKNNAASNWITLKPQNPNGVTFTASSTLQFSGTRILVSGFKFSGGNLGTTGVILFRSNTSTLANYCRITDITIENQINASADTDNKWVSLYGTYNRVDHCTFDTKANAGATVTIWYSTTTYPAKAASTYHQIDYNYFKGRTYQGSNGGESMRLGDSNSSRSDGYNIVEYNLFENMTQDEPEIISNKSNFNTYRYNTIKNSAGGLTLRHGRYCNVYGNFIIAASTANSYGIRVIDKGHAVYNNYIEGVKGNQGSLSSLRCPIILYNGQTLDSTDTNFANKYFPATDCTIAFNTIVNCLGGAGIVLGFKESSASTFVPLNVKVANNLVKMSQGQCAYVATTGTTYTAESNIYNAPSGLGLSSATGFTSATLTFGTRTNGILLPPSLVQDAATNSSMYATLLDGLDVHAQGRSGTYDVGAYEVNGSGNIVAVPLDASMVGAGSGVVVPVQLVSFSVSVVDKVNNLKWHVENEVNFKQYEIEYSTNGKTFEKIGVVSAKKQAFYDFQDHDATHQNGYYRLKLMDFDGQFSYSKTLSVSSSEKLSLSVYPNPAQHFLTIDVNGALNAQTSLVLYDATGKAVKTIMVTNPSNRIPLQNLAKGLYHVQLVQQNNVVATYPFVIQ